MRLLYLPPYSPDFNPIEEGFSIMKAWIRTMFWENCPVIQHVTVFTAMTPENIVGWYRDSGYVA